MLDLFKTELAAARGGRLAYSMLFLFVSNFQTLPVAAKGIARFLKHAEQRRAALH
jgi:hypothetical protein